MPELPEVQTTVDGLNKTVKGRTITAISTTYNSPYYKGKEEINQLSVAQQAISNSMKTGDFSKASQFSRVPFQGQFLPPQVLENLYQLLQGKNTGYTPNTLLRK